MQNPVRAYWLECHRRVRIAVREISKAALDVAIYGQGATKMNARTGEIRHVPISELLEVMKENP